MHVTEQAAYWKRHYNISTTSAGETEQNFISDINALKDAEGKTVMLALYLVKHEWQIPKDYQTLLPHLYFLERRENVVLINHTSKVTI